MGGRNLDLNPGFIVNGLYEFAEGLVFGEDIDFLVFGLYL